MHNPQLSPVSSAKIAARYLETSPINFVDENLSWWEYQEDSDEANDSDDWRKDEWWSLECSLFRGGGDCDDYAIASAALLKDRGYLPFILSLPGQISRTWFSKDASLALPQEGHAVHLLIDSNNLIGINGINERDKIPPQYSSLEELFSEWEYTKYIVRKKIKYQIVDLSKVDFVWGEENLLSLMYRSLPEGFQEIENLRYEVNQECERQP